MHGLHEASRTSGGVSLVCGLVLLYPVNAHILTAACSPELNPQRSSTGAGDAAGQCSHAVEAGPDLLPVCAGCGQGPACSSSQAECGLQEQGPGLAGQGAGRS